MENRDIKTCKRMAGIIKIEMEGMTKLLDNMNNGHFTDIEQLGVLVSYVGAINNKMRLIEVLTDCNIQNEISNIINKNNINVDNS